MTATIASPRIDLLTTRLEQLYVELDEVQLELIVEAAGDVADRATNVDANIRFALIEQRITAVEFELAELPHTHHHDGEVTVGDVVTLDFGDGPELFLVGSVDEVSSDIEVLTPSSPLGQVVVGAKVGASVSYHPQPGRTMHVTVLAAE